MVGEVWDLPSRVARSEVLDLHGNQATSALKLRFNLVREGFPPFPPLNNPTASLERACVVRP